MSEITLGIIGGGQLGSMLAIAAKKLNVKTVIFCDDIVISAQLANGTLGHHLVTNKLNGKIIDIEDKANNAGLWKSHPNWKELRNETAQFHFKEKG